MKKTSIFIFIIFTISSCKKILLGENLATNNPKENFEYLWNECNEKYSYFDLKKIDWEQIREKYEPKISEKMTDDSLFKVLGAMLKELKDDHTNLISPFNISFFGVTRNAPDNFDWRIIQDNYLPKDYYISGPFTHDFVKGTNNKIGYIRFRSFSGGISPSNLEFALKRYEKTNGLILDLRENGGGLVSDVFNLLSRFTDEKILLYYSRIKTGKGKNDFSDAEPAYLEPANTKIKFLKKIIMLVDRGTYSAGSLTSLATKAFPNIVLMGDTTGGGLGLPNGGQLPNGWTYRFSITQTLTLNKKPDYENGVPPDIFVRVDWADRTKDEVIERAIEEIKN